jgi:diguanylate cyclase (GGDEF)-like protein/PAS domain S-box-containing protein
MKKRLSDLISVEVSNVTLKVALLVFVSEIAIMALLDELAIVHSNLRDFLDATLLVLITSPALYYLIVRPYIFTSKFARENASALREKEEQLRYVLQGSELGFWDWNIVTNEVQRNARWAEMLGYSFSEIQNTTKQWTEFIYPDDREKAWQSINDVLEGISPAHKAEYRMLHKDGSVRWILDQANVIHRSADGKPTRMSGTHLDISERMQNEEMRREGSLRLNRILDNLFAYVALLDTNGVVQEVNKAPLDRAGYRREDVIGQYFYDAPWWNYDDEVRTQLIAAINAAKQGESSRYDVVVKMGDDLVPIDFLIAPIRDGYGQIIGLLPTAVDITERKNLEDELQRQAHLDYLTGLPNRRSFMEQTEVEMSRTQRYDNTFSILMLDIDYFKQINDAHGHQAGDLVLKRLSMIFQEVLRNVDIAGRLGGEEFAIALPETGIEKAVEVAERLREIISSTEVSLPAGLQIHFTVSIGIAALVDKNANIETLLYEADKALYRAKQTGRNKVCT